MKIAQITCVYPPYKGGIATSAVDFARTLSSDGHSVETFTIDYGGEKKKGDAVYLKALPGLGKGGFLSQLFFRLKDFDRVILHYPFFGTAEIVWFLKKFFWKDEKKLFVHYHMDVELPGVFLRILSLPSTLIFNSLFESADVITCASLDYVRNGKLRRLCEKHPEKFFEIPFGVDTKRFSPAIFNGDDKRTFNVLFVGGLDKAHYFKGISVLLGAFAKVYNSHKDGLRMTIVGSGDLEYVYKGKAKELGIGDAVDFLGRVSDDDLPDRYKDADCLVLPSINKGEAFGIVLVEAMSCGLPVIASNLPGVRGVFEDGKQGFLVSPGDEDSLAEKIEYLFNNSERRKNMGGEARVLVESIYDKGKIDKRFLDVLVG